MTRHRSTSAIWVGLLVMLVSSAVSAQDSFKEDLRSQPFVYGSFGAFPSGAAGGATYGFGLGMDFLAFEGLGLGGDLAIFGTNAYGFAIASFMTSYHFVPSSSRVVPFVKAGIGAGGEIGYGGVTFASFGGGVNLWKLDGAAIRIEVMDRFPTSGGDHHISLNLGVTF